MRIEGVCCAVQKLGAFLELVSIRNLGKLEMRCKLMNGQVQSKNETAL